MELARVLSDEFQERVVIIDISNEIGRDGDIPHSTTGGARRMQVPQPTLQHGEQLQNIIKNPTLSDLIGGIGTVTLGDEEARARRSQKSIFERKLHRLFIDRDARERLSDCSSGIVSY